ncbi:MAG: hypothetical protein AAGF47_06365 [Planctomycetota bacterium]
MRKPAIEPAHASAAPQQPTRVWIIDATGRAADRLLPVLDTLDTRAECLGSYGVLATHLARPTTPAGPTIVVLANPATGLEDLRALTADHPGAVAVVLDERPTLDSAVEAMRLGAADLITADDSADELQAALGRAIDRARSEHRRDARVERLRGVCRRLNDARQQITSQVSGMCNDLVDAYQELSGQIDTLSLCAEFNGVVRQELDIESLLRVSLEFILAKVGPTNAAVFLPAATSEFSLGAYVNCDLASDAVEPLLDHLGETLAPRFEHRPGIHVFADRHETAQLFGGDPLWLEDRGTVVFPCHQDDECLAVVALFRDERQPFSADDAAALDMISRLFAAQLSRVIHVHHRHLPKDQWGWPSDELESVDDDQFDGLTDDEPNGWAEDDLDQAA